MDILGELKENLNNEHERLGVVLTQRDELFTDLTIKKNAYMHSCNTSNDETEINNKLNTYVDIDCLHEEMNQMIKDIENKIHYYQQFIFDMSTFKLINEDNSIICENVFGYEIFEKCKPHCNMNSKIKNPNDQIIDIQMFNCSVYHPYIHIHMSGTFTLINQ